MNKDVSKRVEANIIDYLKQGWEYKMACNKAMDEENIRGIEDRRKCYSEMGKIFGKAGAKAREINREQEEKVKKVYEQFN